MKKTTWNIQSITCVCVYVHVWGDDFNMIAAAMGRRFKMLNP